MKKIFTLFLIISVLFCSQTGFAASYVYEQDFEADSPVLENAYVKLSGVIGTESDNSYIQYITGETYHKLETTFKNLPDDLIIMTADLAATHESQQLQIWRGTSTSPGSAGALVLMRFGYVPHTGICSDWHKFMLILDRENANGKAFVDGVLKYDMDLDLNNWDWTADNAEILMQSYGLKFDNIKIAYDDYSGLFGIDKVLFNDVECVENQGDFGKLPTDLSKISVYLNYPMEDKNVAPVVLKKDGVVVDGVNCVYNEQTGYYDITLSDGFEKGPTYNLVTKEGLSMPFGAYRTDSFTFNVAQTALEFSTMNITTLTGTRAEIQLTNNSFDESKATVVMFVYDNATGMMVDCTAGAVTTVAPIDSETIYAELTTSYTDGYTVKAYVWDNITSAIPMLSVSQ